MTSENEVSQQNSGSHLTAEAEKGGFRKRRLSLPSISSSNNGEPGSPRHASDDSKEASTASPEKAHTFRKRRLSLTQNKLLDGATTEDTDASHPPAKRRRSSVASAASNMSALSGDSLNPRIQHASELLHHVSSPATEESHHEHNILYTQQHLPPQYISTLPYFNQDISNNMAPGRDDGKSAEGTNVSHSSTMVQPRWKVRHLPQEHKLPFPKEVVGSWSCHGIEPIYDSEEENLDDCKPDAGSGPFKNVATALTGAAVSNSERAQPSTIAKINQDRGGVAYPYGKSHTTALFAVYDGHGQGGEFVSQYALHEIQRRLEKHPAFATNIDAAMIDTFTAVDNSLKDEPMIEPLYAGTTACVVLLRGKTLTMANVGDSRAVLARKEDDSDELLAINLTSDQNPDVPEEMERIHRWGGFVTPPPAPGLSARVWLDAQCQQVGLAMSRSIGDHAASQVGVIAEPVVTSQELDPNDEFMILATDGVWEFLDSDDAVQVVAENLGRGATKACQALIEKAAAAWHKEEGEYRDDITAIVVRLKPDLWSCTGRKTNS